MAAGQTEGAIGENWPYHAEHGMRDPRGTYDITMTPVRLPWHPRFNTPPVSTSSQGNAKAEALLNWNSKETPARVDHSLLR